jgi:excisionase family DNA binding protein
MHEMQDSHESQESEVYYSIREAASQLRVAESTVWRWVDKGLVPAYRLPGRRIRIKKADVDMALKPTRQPAARQLHEEEERQRQEARRRIAGTTRAGQPADLPDWRKWIVKEHGVGVDIDDLMKRAQTLHDEMLTSHGGKHLPSSVDDLREAREELGRRLDEI